MKSYTFLASPYTHEDPNVMELRYYDACRATAWLAKQGLVVHSPIVQWHHVAKMYSLPKDASFWHEQNYNMLYFAGRFLILAIDGWKTSLGVQQELRQAESLGTPICLMVPVSAGEYSLHEYQEISELASGLSGSNS